jgi:hypothetical protein
MSSFIFRDSSQVVAAQGDKILSLSPFSRIPTSEISENGASNSLRRKEFGKIIDDGQNELCPIRPVYLR